MVTNTQVSLFIVVLVLRWYYQFVHWSASGKGSYSDHLLMQRLYEELDAQIDPFAEKIMGQFGSMPSLAHVLKAGSKILKVGAANLLPLSVEGAHSLLLATREVLKLVDQDPQEPGMSDFLQSLDSLLQTHVYLLGRRLS